MSGHDSEEPKGIGGKNEKAWKKFQEAANRRRKQMSGRHGQKEMKPVNVQYQKWLQGKTGKGGKKTDEIRKPAHGSSRKVVVDHKARHVNSERNKIASGRVSDINAGLDQVKGYLSAGQQPRGVGHGVQGRDFGPGTTGKVVRTIWDSDHGRSSRAQLPEWRQEGKSAPASWVEGHENPSERALAKKVHVVTTTHDRVVEATKEINRRFKAQRRVDIAAGARRVGAGIKAGAGAILSIGAYANFGGNLISGNYADAAKDAAMSLGARVLSTTPLGRVALTGVAIISKSQDPELREFSLGVGEDVAEFTGSKVVGALAAAGTHVAVSTGAVVADMAIGAYETGAWLLSPVEFDLEAMMESVRRN
jgi:hypothetical protein